MPKPLDPTGLAGAFAKKGPPAALDFLVPKRAPSAQPSTLAKAENQTKAKTKSRAKAKTKHPTRAKVQATTPAAKTKPKAQKPRTRRSKKQPDPVFVRNGAWVPGAPLPPRASLVRRAIRRLIRVPVRLVGSLFSA